jgi:N,N-dimethylformamidase
MGFTGEMGGLWWRAGRPPQTLVGNGFIAQGFDASSPYRRTEASRDPRAAFIFEGVEEDLIGDFPALNLTYGAAGYEIDRADFQLGTPAHALVLASATDFSNCYQRTAEECEVTTPFSGGADDAQIRADMVFFECPNGGAVFSVGSISWCSALSYNGYENSVSRVLHNVVTAFAAEGPLPGAGGTPVAGS